VRSVARSAWCLALSIALQALPAPASAQPADGYWRRLSPPALQIPAAIYDSRRDRFVMFGGRDLPHFHTDLWVLDAAATTPWRQLAYTGKTPEPSGISAAVYDSLRDRMIVFSATDANGTPATSVWALTFAPTPTWFLLETQGTPPTPRVEAAVVYDPPYDRLIVFGGYGGGTTWDEVWALSLGGTPTWSKLVVGGGPPPSRAQAAYDYDPISHRLFVFGGFSIPPQTLLNDLWALSVGASPTWTEIPNTNPPSARNLSVGMVDGLGGKFWVLGGNGPDPRDESWSIPTSGGTWAQGPAPKANAGMARFHETKRRRFTLFGGLPSPVSPTDDTRWFNPANPGPGWTSFGPPVNGSGPRASARIFRDPVRDRFVLFGGIAPVGSNPPPLQYSLAGVGAWSTLSALGSVGSPPLALDAARRQLVAPDFSVNQIRFYDLVSDTWSARSTANLPTNFTPISAVVDSIGDRLLVFGNSASSTTVWAVALGGNPLTWTQLAAAATPAAASGTIAIYDPIFRRVLWFGNGTKAYSLDLRNFPTWIELPDMPASFVGPEAVYDPVHERILIFYAESQQNGATWLYEWDLTLGTLRRLFPEGPEPPPGTGWSAGYDASRNQLFVLGGYDGAWMYENDPPPVPTVTATCPWSSSSLPGTSARGHTSVALTGTKATTLSYTLASTRDWPGFPIEGTAQINPGSLGGYAAFFLDVAVPDTAAIGVHEMRLTVAPVGEDLADSCVWSLSVSDTKSAATVDATCPAPAQWTAGGSVQGQFHASVAGTASPEVEFTLSSARDWPGFPINGTTSLIGGVGTVSFGLSIPDTVAAGSNPIRITFRPLGETVADSCEWIVSGPSSGGNPGAEFTVALSPNPAPGPLTLRLGLPHATTVRAEIRQLIAGRLVFSHDFGVVAAGTHALVLVPDASLLPGAYVVRTYLDGQTRDTKLVVVR
jgi:hypothetical protein